MSSPKILLDMDGVIADFIGGICEHHDRPNPYQVDESALGVWDISTLWNMKHSTFWKFTDTNFWYGLNLTKEAIEIVSICEKAVGKDNVYILTHPTSYQTGECVKGKLLWLKDHFPHYLHNEKVIFTKHKYLLASPDHLLIDDADHNVQDFIEAGGSALTVPRPWNSYHNYQENVSENIERKVARWLLQQNK